MSTFVLIPSAAAERIRSGGTWGSVTYAVSDQQDTAAVIAVSDGHNPLFPTPLNPSGHFLRNTTSRPGHRWYRVPDELHLLWWLMHRRPGTFMPTEEFRKRITSGWKSPGGSSYVAVTYAPQADRAFPEISVPELATWRVTSDAVEPVAMEVQPASAGLAPLAEHWPVADLADTTVLLVGAGSIGGAAALALASYGVGRILLLDPDRLRWHNLVRHIGDARHVGLPKVEAVRRQLADKWPDTSVETFPLNVVTDADQVRLLVDRSDLVLCAADGVAPRRVVSHLSRRGGIPTVLACVLEDGALGEVLRLHPWADHGCLTCRREALAEQGALDPEPSLDAGYGTGTRHRPMTAVAGDLHLVGQLAAKTAVATVLERAGHADQTLPGEHALLALRPIRPWPEPFTADAAGSIRWFAASPPRAGCPTCEGP